MSKQTKLAGSPPNIVKQPRLDPKTIKPYGKPAWKVGRIDFDGPWCPKGISKNVLLEILEKLKGFERNTWPEIERGGSHFIPVAKIISPAQKRLAVLHLDDTDELFSLRLSNCERLWGIRSNEVFSVL